MSVSNAQAADKPLWINNSDLGCRKNSELCTVGFGISRDEAIRNSKVELLKVFSTNISSKFESNLSAGSTQSNEDFQEVIKEETQGVLEGVQINKVYEQNDGFYVLANLNKRQAGENLKLKITGLDTEIKIIYDDKDSVEKTNLQRLFAKRQALNQTYLFLIGTEIPSPISSELILKSNKEALKGVTLHIHFDEHEPKPLEAETIKYFSDLGYTVVTGVVVNSGATHFITGKVISEKQYINVRGFKKYKVVLKITVSNNKKIETSHLNLESSSTGRNYQHALEGAIKEITNDLKEKINDLNIE